LKHGFERLGLTRIVAITAVDNEASGRVLEAIGMRFEKRMRVPGHAEDSLLYAAGVPRALRARQPPSWQP
jgi:[ribosomal protein S5]-alanine N-acetyltransferase